MSNELIEKMISAVECGGDAAQVWESTLVYGLGTSVKIKDDLTAKTQAGEDVQVTKGTVATICGVGGGHAGLDKLVDLPSGKKVVIPFEAIY